MFYALAGYNPRWLQDEFVVGAQSDLVAHITAEVIDRCGWIIEIQYIGNQYRGNSFATGRTISFAAL